MYPKEPWFKPTLKSLLHFCAKYRGSRPIKKLLLALSVILLASCQTPGKVARKTIFFDPNWPTVATGSKRAHVTGFMIDLISQDKDTEYQFSVHDHLLYQLEQRECDAIIASIPNSPEYREKFTFSESLIEVGPLFVAKSMQPIQLNEIKNKKIALTEDESSYLIAQTVPEVTLVRYTDISAAFNDLDRGKIDLILTDALTALSYCEGAYKNKLHIVSRPLNDAAIQIIQLKTKSQNPSYSSIKNMRAKWGLTIPIS